MPDPESERRERRPPAVRFAQGHALTPRELADRWRCRLKIVRGMIDRGELPAIQIGGRERITPEAIHQAETGTLAVRPKKRRKREAISAEVARLLED